MKILDVGRSVSGRIKKGGSPLHTHRDHAETLPFNTPANITIADLIDDVKSTHRSILSQNVLEHFNEERPKDGYWTNRVLFSQLSLDTDTETAVSAEEIERNQNAQEPLQDTDNTIYRSGTEEAAYGEADTDPIDESVSINRYDVTEIKGNQATANGLPAKGARVGGPKSAPQSSVSKASIPKSSSEVNGKQKHSSYGVEEDTNPIDESVSINRYDVTEIKGNQAKTNGLLQRRFQDENENTPASASLISNGNVPQNTVNVNTENASSIGVDTDNTIYRSGVESRRTLSEEERKNTPPNVGSADVVFAEDGTSSSRGKKEPNFKDNNKNGIFVTEEPVDFAEESAISYQRMEKIFDMDK